MRSETLGNFLKKVRQDKGLELKEVEEKIKISEPYLQALEEGDYHKLPSPTYTRGFLEHYAEFLGLEVKPIIERYRQESRFFEVKEKVFKKKGPNQPTLPGFRTFLKRKRIISFDLERFGIFIIFIIFLIYFIWLIIQTILPPKVIIFSPPDNFETKEKVIQIKGKVTDGAVLKINGQIISKIEREIFNETINLTNGVNLITISAKKRYSPETIIQRRIIVRE